RLTAPPPLDHTLQTFQGVKSVSIRSAEPERYCLGNRRLERWVENRPSNRQRYGGARHKGEANLLRPVVDGFRLLPRVRKVLVEKCRDRPAGLLVNIHDLVEEFIARIQNLPDVVGRIISMLADEHDTFHGERFTAKRQSFPDRGIEFES